MKISINIGELQVVEDRTVTKRISGILGEKIETVESYVLTSTPKLHGNHLPLVITPVSMDYYNGIAVKSDGISEYVYNDSSTFAKSMVINGPMLKSGSGTIEINPMYTIEDTAEVESAEQVDGNWVLKLKGKNYLYSRLTGTPVTGKLTVLGRSFYLTLGDRIAKITIDQVLKVNDNSVEMTSDEYNQRVAEEIQRKIDYFYGSDYATAKYDTEIHSYVIQMTKAGANEIKISEASSTEDLSYFGFVAPKVVKGSEPWLNTRIVFMTGKMANIYGYTANIISPEKVSIDSALLTLDSADDIVGEKVLVVSARPINYYIVVFK